MSATLKLVIKNNIKQKINFENRNISIQYTV